MSVLTRVFVVVLVVLSLLLSAAAVTFLNTIPGLQADLETSKEAIAIANATAARSTTAADTRVSNARREVDELVNRLNSAQTDVGSLRAQLDETRAEAARLQSQLALEQATVSATAQAVTVTTQQYDALQQQLASLRGETSQITEQYGATQAQLNQVQNELTFTRRALRAEQEKIAELTAMNGRMKSALGSLGMNSDAIPANLGAKDVNGIITGRTELENGPYAQISIGSEDDVRTGMELAVFDDRTGALLGLMTVEEVDNKTAFGSLRGDRVGEIARSDRVRTASN